MSGSIYGQTGLSVLNFKLKSNIEKYLRAKAVQHLLKDSNIIFQRDKYDWFADDKNQQAIQEYVDRYRDVISAVNYKALRNTLTISEQVSLFQNSAKNSAKKHSVAVDLEDFYKLIGKDTLESIFDNNSGNDRLWTRIDKETLKAQFLNFGVFQTTDEMSIAIKNARQNGFVAYDTETFSEFDPDTNRKVNRLLEFSFNAYNYDDKNLRQGEYFSSIIGISESEKQKCERILDKVDAGITLTESESVTFENLSLVGHSNTEIAENDGIFRYSKFAAKTELNKYDSKDARKGLQELLRIGKIQSSTEVEYQGYTMQSWEKEFFRGLESAFNSDKTAIGFNSTIFDKPVLLYQLKHECKASVQKNMLAMSSSQKIPRLVPKMNLMYWVQSDNSTRIVSHIFAKTAI